MRTGFLALTGALGVAAVWLVVFGAGQKQVQFGVLLGLWAALIAAFLYVGGARSGDGEFAAELEDARARAEELHEAQLKVVAQQQEQLEAARQVYFSQEIELRQFSELQLARDATARRESEQDLQLVLRHEVERVLADQLSSLRQEVASLRAEVVDKLGGQLRLERIETTRVIGSDLEALQHEIRRLAAVRQDSLAAPPRSVGPTQSEPERVGRVVEAEPPRPNRVFDSGPERVSRVPDAELVEFLPPATELPPASMARAGPATPAVSTSTAEPATPAGPPPAVRQVTRLEPSDPFASLPRLTPVQADLDLIPDPPPVTERSEPGHGRRRAPEPEDEGSRYQGRRRAGGAHASWLASLDG